MKHSFSQLDRAITAAAELHCLRDNTWLTWSTSEPDILLSLHHITTTQTDMAGPLISRAGLTDLLCVHFTVMAARVPQTCPGYSEYIKTQTQRRWLFAALFIPIFGFEVLPKNIGHMILNSNFSIFISCFFTFSVTRNHVIYDCILEWNIALFIFKQLLLVVPSLSNSNSNTVIVNNLIMNKSNKSIQIA